MQTYVKIVETKITNICQTSVRVLRDLVLQSPGVPIGYRVSSKLTLPNVLYDNLMSIMLHTRRKECILTISYHLSLHLLHHINCHSIRASSDVIDPDILWYCHTS